MTLLVEGAAEARQPPQAGEMDLGFLLRLPVGVRLESEEWEAVELPPKERADPSGPWALFQRRVLVRIPSAPAVGAAPSTLYRMAILLTVAEPGVNWVITARVRPGGDAEAWQAFGVLFATRQGEKVEFHTAPKAP